MQTTARIVVSAVIITSAMATVHQNSAKLRRDGVLNLYPFPRVGRGSVQQTWELPFNDLYIEYRPTQKRQLYAFPRVGRHGAALDGPMTLEETLLEHSRSRAFSKRGSNAETRTAPETDSNGMWFGPRLGRSFKDDIESERDFPGQRLMINDLSEPEQIDQTEQAEREKRQVV